MMPLLMIAGRGGNVWGSAAGMVCHTAATGEAGLRLIREYEPDLVLLGILRNGEGAFQLCREIRRT
jgi:DNA-binding response OmpR family regulator